jgi:ectoine hydroxylase-related dioxygenase (phytanoyl-CoA dioxygenase family)
MNALVDSLRDRSFWTSVVPDFRIEDRASFGHIPLWDFPKADEDPVTVLDREGYLHLPDAQGTDTAAHLSSAVRRLVAAGLPPVFGMVFDEFWIPAFALTKIVATSLGGTYKLLPDFWIWHIDPAKDEAGWSPHRDKGHRALFPDRRPKAVTAWLALSEADPLNSCMYLVPAHRDPTYGTERDSQWTFAYPDVRALPAAAGDVFVWNQAVLHWGAHASAMAKEPRISMAFEFQRDDVAPFNGPLIPATTILRFEDRLKLIGKQILQYKHMYRVAPEVEEAARALVGSHSGRQG